MSGLRRSELKSIIKECLVEILNEGLGGQSFGPASVGQPLVSGAVTEQRMNSARRRPAFDPKLDTPLGKGRQPTDHLRETIQRESGGNPVLADMLADTAMTTLPAQLAHGDTGTPPPGSRGSSVVSRDHAAVQQEQFNGNPDEVFGEGGALRVDGSSHWADLAFMGTSKKSI